MKDVCMSLNGGDVETIKLKKYDQPVGGHYITEPNGSIKEKHTNPKGVPYMVYDDMEEFDLVGDIMDHGDYNETIVLDEPTLKKNFIYEDNGNTTHIRLRLGEIFQDGRRNVQQFTIQVEANYDINKDKFYVYTIPLKRTFNGKELIVHNVTIVINGVAFDLGSYASDTTYGIQLNFSFYYNEGNGIGKYYTNNKFYTMSLGYGYKSLIPLDVTPVNTTNAKLISNIQLIGELGGQNATDTLWFRYHVPGEFTISIAVDLEFFYKSTKDGSPTNNVSVVASNAKYCIHTYQRGYRQLADIAPQISIKAALDNVLETRTLSLSITGTILDRSVNKVKVIELGSKSPIVSNVTMPYSFVPCINGKLFARVVLAYSNDTIAFDTNLSSNDTFEYNKYPYGGSNS